MRLDRHQRIADSPEGLESLIRETDAREPPTVLPAVFDKRDAVNRLLQIVLREVLASELPKSQEP
jgi:hypothetical protein